ncbi:MAG: hypothetical protein VKL20_08385 [Synechocystis sp.]|nr:hypothetical protein [Synechocystis sp.]
MNHLFIALGCTTLVALTSWTGLTQAQSVVTMSPPIIAQGANKTYNGPEFNFPLKTQYPNTMQVDDGCAGEGCGFSFTFLPQDNALDNAEVHVFIPRGTKTAAEQAVFITGPNGLIENNAWAIVSLGTTTPHLPAEWVKQVINFAADDGETGQIILGEVDGQAIQVMIIYPAAMADQFWAAADVVLRNLTFETNLLPLQPSSEGGFQGEDPATMCDPTKEPC